MEIWQALQLAVVTLVRAPVTEPDGTKSIQEFGISSFLLRDPGLSARLTPIDCGHCVVGVDLRRLEETRDDFLNMIKQLSDPRDRLSLSTLTAFAGGSGQDAFRLIALGVALKIWAVDKEDYSIHGFQ